MKISLDTNNLTKSLNVKTLILFLKGNKKLLSKYVNAGIVAANSTAYVLGELVKHLIAVQGIDLEQKLIEKELDELQESLFTTIKEHKELCKCELFKYISEDHGYDLVDPSEIPVVAKWLESKKPLENVNVGTFTRLSDDKNEMPGETVVRKYDMKTHKWLDSKPPIKPDPIIVISDEGEKLDQIIDTNGQLNERSLRDAVRVLEEYADALKNETLSERTY
jgi:hypothetical protein